MNEYSVASLKKPRICCVKLFERCFMKCKMCTLWKNNTYPSDVHIPLQQWEKFLISLRKLVVDPIEISLSGGEPLIYKDIFDLIKMIDGFGFITFINSNGYLINKIVAKKIVDSNLKRIGLSLDSLNSDTHDYIRGRRGSFKKLMHAIRHLRDMNKNLDIGIMTTIMEKNIDDILFLVDWVQNNNDINTISFQMIMQPFGEDTDENWHYKDKYKELWPQNINKVHEVLDSLIKLKKTDFCKITNSIYQLEMYKEYFKEPGVFIKKDRICNLLYSRIFIDPYGRVYLCTSKGKIGDVSQDAEELYFSEKAQQVRTKMISCKQNCHELINCSYEDQ